jgi:hypothetical protein
VQEISMWRSVGTGAVIEVAIAVVTNGSNDMVRF